MTMDEAEDAVESMLGENPQFGEAGKTVVIEEFMEGEEASLFALCDGKNYRILPTAQDHKRIGEGDKGLNTGGMGAYAPAPIMSEKLIKKVEKEVVIPTWSGMEKEGCPYVGFPLCRFDAHDERPEGRGVQLPSRGSRGPGRFAFAGVGFRQADDGCCGRRTETGIEPL